MTAFMFLILAASGMEIWAEPTLIHVMDPTRKSDYAMASGRLQAARGEYESLQICVLAGRRGLENARLDARPVSDTIAAPVFQRLGVARVNRPEGAGDYRPDVLMPAAPFSLAAREAAVFWVTYHISREAPPGNREHSLRLYSEDKEIARFRVRLEIFDFSLPEQPSLPAIFTFDHRNYAQTYALSLDHVEAWKPFYETIGQSRVSIQWRHPEDLVAIDGEGAAETALFKKHLDAIREAAHPAGLELAGPAGRLLYQFPAPRDPVPGSPDHLISYLREMTDTLNLSGWKGLSIVNAGGGDARGQWPAAQRLFWRAGRAGRPLIRLSQGPVHPFFERDVEAWAVPLEQWSLELLNVLGQGRSLSGSPPLPAAEISASSSGPLPGYPNVTTLPEEAYDSSLFTAWTPVHAPALRSTEWIELHFDQPLTTQHLSLAWAGGALPSEIEVLTSFDGEIFTTASASWRHQPAMPPGMISVSNGTLRYSNTFLAIRLAFRLSDANNPIALAEICFNPAEDWLDSFSEPAKFDPRMLWLHLQEDRFPSMRLDAHAVESRLAPWVCWGHRFSGILGGALNAWPREWNALAPTPPLDWISTDAENLSYPGPGGMMPSARLMRLRDGLEDYEYLVLLREAVMQGAIDDPRLTAWAGARYFAPRLGVDVLRELTGEIPEIKARIGRALSRLPKEKP